MCRSVGIIELTFQITAFIIVVNERALHFEQAVP
jgi:hypothetical protein